MDFNEAKKRLGLLKQQLSQGQINGETFAAQVALLRLQDGAGSWWQLSQDGQWLFWDGKAWLVRVPPVTRPEAAPVEHRQPQSAGQSQPAATPSAPKSLAQLVTMLIPLFIKSWLKSIPLMVLMSALIFAVHTFLVVYVNEGFALDSSNWLLSMVLVLKGNFVPGILFWTFFSAISTYLLIQIFRSGFSKVYNDATLVPSWVRQSVDHSGAASTAIVLGCASSALLVGSVINNRLVSLQLMVMMIISLMSRQQGLMVIALPLAWSDVNRFLNRPHAGYFNPAWVGACLFGALLGFATAVLMPYAPFLGIGIAVVLGVIAIKMLSNQRYSPPMAMLMLLPIGAAMISWLVDDAYADDGGWSESGGTFQGWVKSQGAVTAVGIGLPPTAAANVGVAAGAAISSVPDIAPPETTPDDDDKKQWIDSRKQDLKAALDQKAFIEANKAGYGGAGYDTSEHNRQISDLDRRIAQLQGQLAGAGAGLDYTPEKRDPIGPGKEFDDMTKQQQAEKVEREKQRALALEQAKQQAAANLDRMEKAKAAADEELHSASSLAQGTLSNIADDGKNIVKETIEDGAGLVKDGVVGAYQATKDIYNDPSLIMQTAKNMSDETGLTDVAEAVNDVINDPGLITETAKNIGEGANEGFETAKNAVKDGIKAAGNAVNDVADTASEIVKDPNIISDTITGTAGDISDGAKQAWDSTKQIANDTYEVGSDLVKNPIAIGAETLKQTAGDIVDMGDRVTDAVHKQFTDRDTRNKMISKATGFENLKDATDPNKSLGDRITNYAEGVAKVLTINKAPLETIGESVQEDVTGAITEAIGNDPNHTGIKTILDVHDKIGKINDGIEALTGKNLGETTVIGQVEDVPEVDTSKIFGSKKLDNLDHIDDLLEKKESYDKIGKIQEGAEAAKDLAGYGDAESGDKG